MVCFQPQQKNLESTVICRSRILSLISFILLLVLTSSRATSAQSTIWEWEAGDQQKEAGPHQPPVAESLRLVKRLQLPEAAKLGILRGQGKYLAVWRKDQTIQVWDVNAGRQMAKVAAPSKLYGINLTDDGQRLVMAHSTSRLGYRNTFTVWDVAKGWEVAVLKGRLSLDDALHPKGRLAIAWGKPGQIIQVVDTTDGKEISKFPLQERHRYHKPWLTFSPDGERLALGLHDVFPSRAENLVAVYEVAGGRVLAVLDHTPKPKEGQKYLPREVIQDVDFSPDGRLLATGTTSMICLWEVATGRQVARREIPGGCKSLWFSPDSRLLATAVGRIVGKFESERTVKVWDTASGEDVASLRHDDVVWRVQFSPAGRLLATGSGDFEVWLWQVDTGKKVASLIDPAIYSFNVQADGKHLVTWGKNNVLQVWEFQPSQAESSPSPKGSRSPLKMTEMKRLEHGGPVSELCFSPQGNLLATAEKKTVRVWEVAGGREVNHWEEPGRVHSLTFSPDGRWLATASGKEEKDTEVGRITLWEVGNNKPQTLSSLSTMLWSLTFSPDSRWLAAGCNDATARVWEMATGKEMMQITHPEKNDRIQKLILQSRWPASRYRFYGHFCLGRRQWPKNSSNGTQKIVEWRNQNGQCDRPGFQSGR